MNLLLVNDEEITVETMRHEICWEQYGIYEVFAAYSAESAKRCIERNRVDLMLCDIEMPGENGISLLRWVRNEKKEVECIFLTCHASFDYAKAAIGLDCQDYLLIPAKYEVIGETVKKVVDRIQNKRDNRRYLEYGKSAIKVKLDHAVESHGEKNNPHTLVENTIEYISTNLCGPNLSVQDVSDHLFLHPYYLNRIFKKYMSTSISQYIITERMKLAAELLAEGKLNANSVAEEVGYKSYSNFNLTFKKYFGCAPSKFIG